MCLIGKIFSLVIGKFAKYVKIMMQKRAYLLLNSANHLVQKTALTK